jgi:membrane fusion protein (multidrug efflux system)
VEVDRAPHPIEAPVAGTVVASHLVIGREVAAGDVLVELDVEPLRLLSNEELARRAALAPQLDALDRRIEAERQALAELLGAARSRVDEAGALKRQAQSAAELANHEMKRSVGLHGEGVQSELESLRAQADATQKRAAAEAARLAIRRIDSETHTAELERRATLAELEQERSELSGEQLVVAASIARLEHEIERRTIRAPIAGRLGEAAVLRPGVVLKEADRLGAIVPSGNLRIVAEYQPAALGRIRPGQSARLEPDGFPWPEYGALAATVERVANEPRSGRIRVELSIDGATPSAIPVQHGLPGTLEIEVERTSPAVLVLRTTGKWLSVPVPPPVRNDRDESDAPQAVGP